MIKVEELKEYATDPFLKEWKPLIEKMENLIKDGKSSHFELLKTINETIGCLNVYKHNIKEFGSYG